LRYTPKNLESGFLEEPPSVEFKVLMDTSLPQIDSSDLLPISDREMQLMIQSQFGEDDLSKLFKEPQINETELMKMLSSYSTSK
jgi:hypothetical protein